MLCWGSWGLKNNQNSENLGEIWDRVGDGGSESTALPMGKDGTTLRFQLLLGPRCWPLPALVGISYCPDENLVVANGERMQRRELGLLLWSWDQGTNGMSLIKQASRTQATEQLVFCLLREKVGITLKRYKCLLWLKEQVQGRVHADVNNGFISAYLLMSLIGLKIKVS